MHKKIIMACMAIAAFAAFVAPTASATNLKESGTTLAGTPGITGTNVGNTLFTAGELTVTCTTASIPGKVSSDTGGTIKGEIAKEAPVFKGTGSGEDCTSPLGSTKPTVTSSLCLEVSNSDTGKVTGCGGSVKFTLNVTGLVSCNYSAAEVKGTISTTGDASVNILEQEAKEEGGKFLCPDTGKLDMEFVLATTAGGTLQFTS